MNTGLNFFKTSTKSNSCGDSYDFGFRVGDLADKCKVPPNNNPPGKPGFALYRQDLIIYYTEWAPLKVIGNGTIRREAIGMYGRVLKVLLLHEYSHKLRT